MTIEERLVEALSQIDDFQPSVDLFARVERSLDEDRAFRRRRLASLGAVTLSLTAVGVWLALSTSPGLAGHLFIDGWRVALAFLAIGGALIVALAPHIRRFARSFVDDVFHMSPATGGKFLAVLDIAYYVTFTGLILIDADNWALAERVILSAALDDLAFRIGFLLFTMGLLHAVNIATLPILGLIYSSIVRRDLRRRAGADAPGESIRALRADSAARGFAVGLIALAVALAISFVVGGPGLLILDGLG
jgi:hypothetical protein